MLPAGMATVYYYSLGIAIVLTRHSHCTRTSKCGAYAYSGCYPQFRDERSINVVILREPYATQASNPS